MSLLLSLKFPWYTSLMSATQYSGNLVSRRRVCFLTNQGCVCPAHVPIPVKLMIGVQELDYFTVHLLRALPLFPFHIKGGSLDSFYYLPLFP